MLVIAIRYKCETLKCTIYRHVYRFRMNFIQPRYQSNWIKYSCPITIFKQTTTKKPSEKKNINCIRRIDAIQPIGHTNRINKSLMYLCVCPQWTLDCSPDFMEAFVNSQLDECEQAVQAMYNLRDFICLQSVNGVKRQTTAVPPRGICSCGILLNSDVLQEILHFQP